MGRLNYIIAIAGFSLILVGGITYGIFHSDKWFSALPFLAGLAMSLTSLLLGYMDRKDRAFRAATRFGINAVVSVLFLAAILMFLQTMSYRHGSRIDTTINRRFSLSEQTVEVLGRLDENLYIYCFFKETDDNKTRLEDLLKEYGSRSASVRYTFIDPDKNPVEARRHDISEYGTIILKKGGTTRIVFEISEQAITNAILRMITGDTKLVYFVMGHSERSISDMENRGLSMLKSALDNENFRSEELFLPRAGRIPQDCDILVIASPRMELFEQERVIIEEYLFGGGKALFFIDPPGPIPGLNDIMGRYGIEVNRDLVVYRKGKLISGNNLTPVVTRYGDHPITNGFRQPTFYQNARSVSLKTSPPTGAAAEIICFTDEEAYGETDIETLLNGKTQFVQGEDSKGPLGLAAASELIISPDPGSGRDGQQPGTSRIVVFGNGDFASNARFSLSGNRDLIMNSFNWLLGEEDLITIRPTDPLKQPLMLTRRQGRIIFWVPVIGMPALFALLGIAVIAHRRRTG